MTGMVFFGGVSNDEGRIIVILGAKQTRFGEASCVPIYKGSI